MDAKKIELQDLVQKVAITTPFPAHLDSEELLKKFHLKNTITDILKDENSPFIQGIQINYTPKEKDKTDGGKKNSTNDDDDKR